MLSHHSFEESTVEIMNDAFDLACTQFTTANEKLLVRAILTVALNGERDVTKLSQFALLSMLDDELQVDDVLPSGRNEELR
nr:MetaGeneMark_Unknown Function [uncultured bacterium]